MSDNTNNTDTELGEKQEALTNTGRTVRMGRNSDYTFADGSDGRVYVDEEGNEYASVTTHISRIDSPKKDSRLSDWEKRNKWLVTATWIDGDSVDTVSVAEDEFEEGREKLLHSDATAVWIGDELYTNKAEYWSAYTRARGTLAHCELIEDLSGDEIWGKEEDEAKQKLKDMDDAEGVTEDFDIGGWETGEAPAEEQVEWIANSAKSKFTDIYEVIFAEQYLIHEDLQYAGQVDLIYLDEDKNICVADLKTGLDIYNHYKTQLVAYSEAMPTDMIKSIIEEEIDTDSLYVDDEDVNIRMKNVRSNWENSEVEEQYASDWRESIGQQIVWFEEQVEENNKVMFD